MKIWLTIILRLSRHPLAAGVLALALMAPLAGPQSAGCAVTSAAADLAGLAPPQRHAVHKSVELIREGDYSFAYLNLAAASTGTAFPAKARLLSAFALLLAGDSLGAFPPRVCRS